MGSIMLYSNRLVWHCSGCVILNPMIKYYIQKTISNKKSNVNYGKKRLHEFLTEK